MPIHITGTGSFIPKNKIKNSSFADKVFFDKDGNGYPNSNNEIIEKPLINPDGDICTKEKINLICALILRLQFLWIIFFVLIFLIS